MLALFSGFGQTFFIAISTGPIRAAFDLTSGEYGGIYMIATLASALTLPILGQIVDKHSVGTTILFSTLMLAAACLLMAFSPNILVLILALYGLRLFGQGMMTHISMTAMGKWFAENRGKAVSIASLGFSGAQALLPYAFVVLTGYISWRQGWVVAAAITVVVALPMTWALMRKERLPRGTVAAAAGDTDRDWMRGEMIRDPLFWITCIGVMAPPFIGTAIFFHQDFMLETKGWSLEVFAASIIVMTVVSVLTGLVAGVIVDRKSAVAILPTFLLPLGIGCLILGFGAGPETILYYMVFQGISNGFSSTIFGAIWPEVYGTKHLGAIRSLIMSMMVLFSALGPGVVGWAIDAGVSFTTQMVWMGAYCLCAAMALLFASILFKRRDLAQKNP